MTRAHLDPRLRQYAIDVALRAMVEQEQSPGAMDRARLLERAGRQCAPILPRLRRIAQGGIGLADGAERRGIELNCDGLIAVLDRVLPITARRRQARQAAEDAVVFWEDGEPAPLYGFKLPA